MALQIDYRPLESLIPYTRNSRTHSDEQVAQIAGSIKEFGFTNPILVDDEGGIIAGHGRVLAARKLGLKEVPTINLGHLSETQRRAYVIADNKLALNAGWDDEMLRVEFAALEEAGFDLGLVGFSEDEIAALMLDSESVPVEDSAYTSKIDAPVYKPEGPKPEIAALYDETRARELIESVRSSELPAPEKAFLLAAASRHIQFDFQQIAEYYAHSSPEVQKLMEDSALVIIDFDKAIQLGYAKLSERISDIYAAEKTE